MNFRDLRILGEQYVAKTTPKLLDVPPEIIARAMSLHILTMCDNLKKLSVGEIEKEQVGNHFANVLICADYLCSRIGVSLEQSVEAKFAEEELPWKQLQTLVV